MSITIAGANTWHANITAPAPLDVAEGTEIGHVMGRQLANRTRFLATLLGDRFVVADADVVTVADASSTYGTIDSEAGTSFALMALQASITAEDGDIIVALAQVTANYSGGTFGELRLLDKGITEEGSHLRLEQNNVNVGGLLSYFRVLGVGEGGGRTIDLEGRVSVAGTVALKGGAQLIAIVFRPIAASSMP